MAKYSTNSGGEDPEDTKSNNEQQHLKIPVSGWFKEALNRIVAESRFGPAEAITRPLEYAIVEWNRRFEQNKSEFDIPGVRVWKEEYRCLECRSANKYLFRRRPDADEDSAILCLNCDHSMSEEEVTRLHRGARIQEMEPYLLKYEGKKLRRKYEGRHRTPMRYRCKECELIGLTFPDPSKVDELICPRCGNKGSSVTQNAGVFVGGFDRYPEDRYHTETRYEPIGRKESRGEFDNLQMAYRDGYED